MLSEENLDVVPMSLVSLHWGQYGRKNGHMIEPTCMYRSFDPFTVWCICRGKGNYFLTSITLRKCSTSVCNQLLMASEMLAWLCKNIYIISFYYKKVSLYNTYSSWSILILSNLVSHIYYGKYNKFITWSPIKTQQYNSWKSNM